MTKSKKGICLAVHSVNVSWIKCMIRMRIMITRAASHRLSHLNFLVATTVKISKKDWFKSAGRKKPKLGPCRKINWVCSKKLLTTFKMRKALKKAKIAIEKIKTRANITKCLTSLRVCQKRKKWAIKGSTRSEKRISQSMKANLLSVAPQIKAGLEN